MERSNEYDMNQKWQRVNRRGELGIRRRLGIVVVVMRNKPSARTSVLAEPE
jgi:hypothetical protein